MPGAIPICSRRAVAIMSCAWSLVAVAAPAGDPHLTRGWALFHNGQLREAEEELRAVFEAKLTSKPDQIQSWLLEGALQAVSMENDLALRAFRRALRLDPNVVLAPDEPQSVRTLFEQATEGWNARVEPRASLVWRIAQLCLDDKLEEADGLLASAGTLGELTDFETSQLTTVSALLGVLKGLKEARVAGPEKARLIENLKRAFATIFRLDAKATLTEPERALLLKVSYVRQVTEGELESASGNPARARQAFGWALLLDRGPAPALLSDRAQQLFKEEQAAAAVAPTLARCLPAKLAQLFTEGNLELADVIITGNSKRLDMTGIETEDLLILQGMLFALESLRRASPGTEERTRKAMGTEGELQAVGEDLTDVLGKSLTRAESLQQLVLQEQLFLVTGLMKAEAGLDAPARVAFARALEIDPNARLSAIASPEAQAQFARVRSSLPPDMDANERPIDQAIRLIQEGRLEQVEVSLVRAGEAREAIGLQDALQVLKHLRRDLLAKGDLERVAQQLAAYGGAPAPVRSMLLAIEGMGLTAAGREGEAREAFVRALMLDPHARLPPLASERARALFEQARPAPPTPTPSPVPVPVKRVAKVSTVSPSAVAKDATSQPPAPRNVVTFDLVPVFVGAPERFMFQFRYERAFGGHVGLAVLCSPIVGSSSQGYYLAGEARLYPAGGAPSGVYLSMGLGLIADVGVPVVVRGGFAGMMAGYQHMLPSGFTLGVSLGALGMEGSTVLVDILPWAEGTIGYAF